jgi:hypothetical protein
MKRIRSPLDTRPELQVIGAASDGLEAVEKAEAARKNGLGTARHQHKGSRIASEPSNSFFHDHCVIL